MKKPDKCFNCKEKGTEVLMKVMFRGKIRWFCDTCYDGYLEEKEGKTTKMVKNEALR